MAVDLKEQKQFFNVSAQASSGGAYTIICDKRDWKKEEKKL